jgi:hypothetical protein
LSRADGSFRLAWRIDGRLIHFGISARTEGWVGVGLDPIVMLDNADFLYGWIDAGGETQVRDARSLGARGPIVEDTARGGSNDILAYGGRLDSGRTTIEIVRLLDTGDEADAPLSPEGGSRIVWAYGPDPSDPVRMRQYGEAYLRPGKGLRAENWWAAVTDTPLYPGGLTDAFLLLATTMVLDRLSRGRLSRPRVFHHIPGWIAVALSGVLSQSVLLAPRGPLTLSALWGIVAAGAAAAALIAGTVEARVAAGGPGPGSEVSSGGLAADSGPAGTHARSAAAGPRRVSRILEWVALPLLAGALAIALIRTGVF